MTPNKSPAEIAFCGACFSWSNHAVSVGPARSGRTPNDFSEPRCEKSSQTFLYAGCPGGVQQGFYPLGVRCCIHDYANTRRVRKRRPGVIPAVQHRSNRAARHQSRCATENPAHRRARKGRIAFAASSVTAGNNVPNTNAAFRYSRLRQGLFCVFRRRFACEIALYRCHSPAPLRPSSAMPHRQTHRWQSEFLLCH